ncbi:hypothetical protein H4W19_14710 [Pseudoxanthomonas mexicana]|uniref:PilJ/NarX-like methyl-accepting chemotaxis transducer n=1 Tax=Pseudoxanthomonas mexicana TaxID=128785 RepID=A0ABX6R8I7_PSEMX|nr:hypothetical protein [Pseudoxanthomonas mexicana]QND79582.1 hypothetical protein H4W19_14710 [Pseudoxanthomonas mexicana]WBX93141.1 hypothetical protein PE064_15865 [Pseudoxanthomonas mexicana]
MKALLKITVLALLPLLSACATQSSMIAEDVGAVRLGIAATRAQANISFNASNDLVREQAVARKISLTDRTISESDFPILIARETTEQWASAFDSLDAYSSAIQSLADGSRAQETGNVVSELAKNLNDLSTQSAVPPNVAGAVSAWASALLQLRSEKRATEIMRATDEKFRNVITHMADAIGTSPTDLGSLQLVVDSNWTNSVLLMIENRYMALAVGDPQRENVARSYIAAISTRDAQLANLSQLRRSLLALADAHTAAANGRPADALYWIKRIDSILDDMQKRADEASKEQGK